MAEASATTVRTVIKSGGEGRGHQAAGLLNGFEGVELDAEAQAAIAKALEACAARAREAEAAYDKGGEAAADAAEQDLASFVPVGERDNPYRGELLPPVQMEEYVPFVPGEAHWTSAGAERPAELVQFEEEMAARKAGRAAEREAGE